MIESIADMLNALCRDIISFYLSEAATEDYPYAVFEYTSQEHRTKDGIYKITADVYIHVYSRDSIEAETKAAAIKSALDAFDEDETDNAGKYNLVQQASSETCTEGIWRYELHYFVRQNY